MRKSGEQQLHPRWEEVIVTHALQVQRLANVVATVRCKKFPNASFLQVSSTEGREIVVAAVHLPAVRLARVDGPPSFVLGALPVDP